MIYLVTSTGYPNYGDELIAAMWLRYLAKVAPDSTVWVDCPNPGPSAVLLGDLHPRVRFTDTMWRLCQHAPSNEPWEVCAHVQRAFANPGLVPRWVAGIELAARADIVHVVGGGFINNIWPRHLGLLAGAVAAVRRSGGRAVMTGQGLSPAPDEAGQLVRMIAGQFATVDVRDTPSAALIDPAPQVTCTGDDMFFGVEPELYRTDDLPRFMVCLQSDRLEMPTPALAGFLLDTLRKWDVRPAELGVVEGIPGADRQVFALVEQHLPGARFYPFGQLMRRGLPAAAGQHWLSSRFHMHLMAAAAGASGVAVSVNADYYATKHRSLIERGSGWSLSEQLQVPELPTGGGFPQAKLQELRQAKTKLAWSIYGAGVR
jgi:hypothetical protein